MSCWEINEASSSMQQTMLLSDCSNNLSRDLSDEQKRVLSLGLAFIGKPEILILDEPTLNISSKVGYHIFTLLTKMRANRIILLSSSCVKDSCTFGDRIAFFSYGQLHFCGSTEFLKKKFDVGYKLHITKDTNFDVNLILNLITNYFSNAHLEKEINDLAIFNLESETNVRLGDLFEKIETTIKEIGVKSFGITCITMEDVFMNEYIVYLKTKKSDFSLEDLGNLSKRESEVFQEESWNLHWSHFCALFYKRYHYLKILWPLNVLSIVLPFILMCVSMKGLQSYVYSTYSSLDMTIKQVYKGSTGVTGFFEKYEAFPDRLHSESIIQTEFLSLMKENSILVYNHTNVTTLLNLYAYTHYPAYLSGFIVGGSALLTEKPHFVAWYNGNHYHTGSIALNLMHTAILRNLTGNGSIFLRNYPLPYNYMLSSDQDTKAPRSVILPVIPVVSALVGAKCAVIPTYEKTSRTKLFQLMSGLSMKMYWMCMFVWDALMHIGISLTLAIPVAIFESIYFIRPKAVGAVFFLFVIFGIPAILICYLTSLFSKHPVSVFIYICLFHAITGFIGTLIFIPRLHIHEVILWVFRIFPCFCMTEGFYKMFYISLNTVSICYGVPEDILTIICSENDPGTKHVTFKCCPGFCEDGSCKPAPYFIAFDLTNGLLREILSMVVLGIILLIMLALCEAAMYQKYKGFIPKKQLIDGRLSRSSDSINFTGVFTEKEHIENLLATGKYRETLMLTILDIAKFYGSISAVEDVTFGVTAGECFGIVGGCGSGKSTLFKMLTGEIIPTAGNAFIKNNNLITHLKEFQSSVGYCPQYDALLNHLTGRQMLRFYSKLRGVVCKDLESALIKMMAIGDHADRLIKYYSFVDKRKLAVALTIIGTPPVLFLDEPSAGVDFISRKIIWNLIYKAKNFKSAIVFSTKREYLHTMLKILF